VDAVAERTELTKTAASAVVDAVLESITGALAKGDQVSLVGFGTFKVRQRGARKGRNPRTNEEITIPAATIPGFTPGKRLKDAVQ
jgi:DNA-binding protein HU-beta